MMNWINKKRNKKGFTLVELVVVIAILGILAAVAVPRFTEQTSKAKFVSDQATARNIIGAINVAVAAGDAEIVTDGIKIKPSIGGVMPAAKVDSAVVLTSLKALSLLDEVPTPQSSGTKFVITVAASVITITDDTTPTAIKFYPAK